MPLSPWQNGPGGGTPLSAARLNAWGEQFAPVTDPDTGGVIPSGSANDFVDSIGVNVHLYFTSGSVNAYEDHTAVRTALATLGVRHVRDTYYNSSTQRSRLRALWTDLGIRFQGIFDSRIDSHVSVSQALDILADSNMLECSAIEGPNEPDIQSFWGVDVAARVAAAKTFQQSLKSNRDSKAALVNVPLVAPSMSDPAANNTMGSISAYCDYGNLHSYPGGYKPRANEKGTDQSLTGWLTLARVAAGATAPVIASETGYHNNVPQLTGHLATSEAVAGIYAAQLPFEYWRRGVARTFFYELFDEVATTATLGAAVSSTGATSITLTAYPSNFPASGSFTIRIDSEAMLVTAGWSTTTLTVTRAQNGTTAATHVNGSQVSLVTGNQENRFGLFNYDRTEKPAATYLTRIIDLLEDTRAAPMTPLGFSIQGATQSTTTNDQIRHVLLQKSDGTWALVLWYDESIFDPTTGLPVSVTDIAATLTLRSARDVTVYSPTTSASSIATYSATSSVPLTLAAAKPLVLLISGGEGS